MKVINKISQEDHPLTMNFSAVLFDLDGTLLDTLSDIGNAMNRVLEQVGVNPHPMPFYNTAIGDGMETLVRRSLTARGVGEAEVPESLEAVKTIYADTMLETTQPYPGIPELLDQLQEAGLPCSILSNKPDALTQQLTGALLSKWTFKLVMGARPDIPRKPDPEGALEMARILDLKPASFLYLGDTNTDMKTATRAGMFPVGVLWGFRERDELRESGAKALLRRPEELLNLLHSDPADTEAD